MIIDPLQGEIWIVALDLVIGHEQAKTRPCLVISDDRLNRSNAGLVIVMPLTSQDKRIPWHVQLNPPEGGLRKVSYIMCEQARVVSKERLSREPLGTIPDEALLAVKARIKFLFNL